MQTNVTPAQLDLDRITQEIAKSWKLSYTVCSAVIREYLLRTRKYSVPTGETKVPSVSVLSLEQAAPAKQEELPVKPTIPSPEEVKFHEVIVRATEVLAEHAVITVPETVVATDTEVKQTKSERIRQMYNTGMTVGKISKALKSNYSYVWAVVDTYKAILERQKLEAEQNKQQA